MANGLFASFRNGVLGAHATYVVLSSDTIKAFFMDHADYTPVLASDAFLTPLVSAGREPAVASAPALASKTVGTVATGVFDAADVTFTALSGDQAESLVLCKSTGTDSTSNLIGFWDTATGLPITPNGGDVVVVWNASGILQV